MHIKKKITCQVECPFFSIKTTDWGGDTGAYTDEECSINGSTVCLGFKIGNCPWNEPTNVIIIERENHDN
jgi:hypothetical protein